MEVRSGDGDHEGVERGSEAELIEYLGYEKGDPEAGFYPNSRNGMSAKTVTTSVNGVAGQAADLVLPDDLPGRDHRET